jgi:hypothetical protein
MYRSAAAAARGAVLVLGLAAMMFLLTGIGARALQNSSSAALAGHSSVNAHVLPSSMHNPALPPTPTPVP